MKPKPSIKRLEASFPGKGAELRALLTREVKTHDYRSVQDLKRACYNPPSYSRRLMVALNEITEGCGVECVRDRNGVALLEYINQGDPYTVTIVRWIASGHIEVTDWGSVAERDNGRRFA